MGGSYRQCEECGKRALSIATRCPGCGRELPQRLEAEARPLLELNRYMPTGMAGFATLVVVLLAVELGDASWPAQISRSSAAADVMVSDSIAASSEVAYALGATAQLDTASVKATPETLAGELLVAKTWTNVRRSRSRVAVLEAVLMPGDTVCADSLHRDWYRVALDGEVMGYAHRTTLAR